MVPSLLPETDSSSVTSLRVYPRLANTFYGMTPKLLSKTLGDSSDGVSGRGDILWDEGFFAPESVLQSVGVAGVGFCIEVPNSSSALSS